MVMIKNNLVQDPPEPWFKVGTVLVGGLYQVGYVKDRDIILIHSASKLTLTDTMTGERLSAGQDQFVSVEHYRRLKMPGFGFLVGEIIPTAGIWGGSLPVTTSAGFSLRKRDAHWPVPDVDLIYPDGRAVCVSTHNVCDIRAYGFSNTSFSFVIATESDVQIFARSHEGLS
ncbi:hypothetical protein HLH26_16435 [Gluconacetobacter sp. 1b LMG 1731]|uniref:Uncharacterized protein n=1 Tax=Gluconacetobacter dulcium TaxID=2729096 RepID=A0A7W4INI5_9PROT|nr:hypothetical protein [Gluconacetobacter dulcium]MBB2166087.1 hypothetical protein [Gluconacetobacter dulcium]MBB2195280.1 hypothetical protein [Gluconacetobacter dulcium]